MKYLIILSTVFLFNLSAFAQGGGGFGSVGNGGEETEVMLWNEARALAKDMTSPAFCEEFFEFATVNNPWEEKEISGCTTGTYQKLTRALRGLEGIEIVATQEVLTKVLNGETTIRTALNFPNQKLIKFNYERTAPLKRPQIRAMIFHEFLGVIGSSLDLKYKLSSRLQNVTLP